MGDVVQVQTTVASKEVALLIGRSLVEARLAACVQVVGPIDSTYRWRGAVETAKEWLCLIKGPVAEMPAIIEAVTRMHTYEVPEIVALPIVGGSQRYLDWIEEATQQQAPD